MQRRPSRRRPLEFLLGAALLFAAGVAVLPAAPLVDRFRDDPDRLVMVTAYWHTRPQLQEIAGHFQHLIVDEKARTARMEASAADLITLRRLGIRAEIDFDATDRMRKAEAAMALRAVIARQQLTKQGEMTSAGLTATKVTAQNAIPGYACYRTVEETYSTMDLLARNRPTLASVVDIGPTWTYAKSNGTQGYRMRVLRLTNSATNASVADKPNMVMVAAIHAREYTTAEIVTRFAEWLANRYGSDPEATWLLDNFRFHFVLQANPDGRKKAESGLSWRKNTDTDNGSCSANAYGVDLNRNFTWRFGTVSGGSSSDACDSTYRGPGAASEEETQNILRYVVGTQGSDGTFTGGVLPDRRTDTGTAPADYRGMFLDIHSYSQLVLWPWAYTTNTPPNAGPLRTLGRRLAYFNSYRPEQWTGLYEADGTNTDTVYGITGAPSYTFELGQEFFEDCATFESTTLPRNFNAFRYAARNLREPYSSPGGPDTTSIGASALSIERGKSFAVSAWIDDGRFNQSNGAESVQAVTGASAFLDAAPWSLGAMPSAMRASDGTFDSTREQVVVNIDTRGLAYGRHVAYVRGTDASGRAGTPSAIYFTARRYVPDQDYDGDGRSDLFWRHSSAGQNVIWRAANSAAPMQVTTVSDTRWKIVAQGDFDGDGRSDLLWRNSVDGANVIWRSANSAAPQAVARADVAWHVAGAGDFNGDGRADLFWRNVSTGQNAIWLSANAASSVTVAAVTSQHWQVVGVGDFDGDVKADVLWHNDTSGANAIWRSGNAATPRTVTTVTNIAWKIVGVGDFNADGIADIFWRNTSDGQNVIWRSANYASPQAVASAATTWRVATTGDFDGDGASDVMWRHVSTGQNVIWKRANRDTPQAVSTVSGQAWTVVPYENQP